MTQHAIANTHPAKPLRRSFNIASFKTKALTLLIEHGPCCILSFAAGLVGIEFLNHNPVLELGFALGGAVIGEHIGHRLFHKNKPHKHNGMRRYGLALAFGLASWGVHQAVLHDHSHHPHAPVRIHVVESATPQDTGTTYIKHSQYRRTMDSLHNRMHKH